MRKISGEQINKFSEHTHRKNKLLLKDWKDMDFSGQEEIKSTAVELDEEFLKELETEEVVLEKGEGMFTEKYPLYFVTNAIDLLNERYNFLRFDPNVDIVKDDYEGGFKVWEGTLDLCNFLYNHGQNFDLNGKNVLEIGCGCGLVGIFCMKAYELNSICFQDYNLDVLKFSTLPNIIKNGLEAQIPKTRFISHDWSTTIEKVSNNVNELATKLHEQGSVSAGKFDMILMSEVLYNPDQYPKLGALINELLETTGICIISSKLYYFGVNGSVDEFKDFMEEHYPHLSIQTLLEIDNKISNKREIFAIGRQNNA